MVRITFPFQNYSIISDEMYKQVIVIRKDLKMSEGKKCAQSAHASLGAFRKAKKSVVSQWEKHGEKKIVLEIGSRNDLLKLFEKAKKEKLPVSLVKDAGLTELESGTVTALGIGPDESKKIDKITGKLKLLK